MSSTHCAVAADLARYICAASKWEERESAHERTCVDAIPEMWEMTLDEMDGALNAKLDEAKTKSERDAIQHLIDMLDDVATQAPSYLT